LNPIPEVAAALVCQVLIVDSITGSKTLANVFSTLHIPIPAAAGFGLYVKMVDGEGSYNLRISLVRLRDDKILLNLTMAEIDWQSRLEPLELAVNFQQVSMEEEGMHEFQIFMDDSIYLGRAPFVVKRVVPPPQVQTGGTV
jgi:hypothetical protein